MRDLLGAFWTCHLHLSPSSLIWHRKVCLEGVRGLLPSLHHVREWFEQSPSQAASWVALCHSLLYRSSEVGTSSFSSLGDFQLLAQQFGHALALNRMNSEGYRTLMVCRWMRLAMVLAAWIRTLLNWCLEEWSSSSLLDQSALSGFHCCLTEIMSAVSICWAFPPYHHLNWDHHASSLSLTLRDWQVSQTLSHTVVWILERNQGLGSL